MVYNIEFSHTLSDDGLTLVSEATMGSVSSRVTTTWRTEELVAENKAKAIESAEKHLREKFDTPNPDKDGFRNEVRRKKFLGLKIFYGSIYNPKAYDDLVVSLGKFSFKIPYVNDRLVWRKRYWTRSQGKKLLFGFGDHSKAVYFSISRG